MRTPDRILKWAPVLVPALFWAACTAPPAAPAGSASTGESAQSEAVARPASGKGHPAAGSYVGLFEADTYDEKAVDNISWSNKITIFLDSVTGTAVKGHSVVAGNLRPFSGTIKSTDRGYFIQVREPGDDRYDGAFEMVADVDSGLLKGKWSAFNKIGVTVRRFSLERRDFQYRPDLELPEEVGWTELYGTYDQKVGGSESLTEDVTRYNASLRLMTREEVENLYKSDLEVIRNAIYARHGYSFRNRRMRYIFDGQVDWYMPVSVDVRDQLTAIEKQNIDLLKRYEQHAVRYYDEFGR